MKLSVPVVGELVGGDEVAAEHQDMRAHSWTASARPVTARGLLAMCARDARRHSSGGGLLLQG